MTGAKEWTQTRLVPNAVSLHLIEAKESRIPKIKHDGLNKYGMSRRLFPEEIIAIENFQNAKKKQKISEGTTISAEDIAVNKLAKTTYIYIYIYILYIYIYTHIYV